MRTLRLRARQPGQGHCPVQGALRFLATHPRGQQRRRRSRALRWELLSLHLDPAPPWGTLGSHLSLSLGRQKMSLLRAVYLGRKLGKYSRWGQWMRSQQVSARQSAQRGQGHWLGPLLLGGVAWGMGRAGCFGQCTTHSAVRGGPGGGRL